MHSLRGVSLRMRYEKVNCISYSVLDPGQVPEIKGVTRFPAHEHISGASKIPTVIYYDRFGKVQAVGAEATVEGIYEQAEDEQWVKAEWCVPTDISLRIGKDKSPTISGPGAGKEVSDDIPPLPLNKTVVEVFADFLAYLFECAANYIQDAHPNGVDLWNSVKGEIDFVLSHPNGWEGTQQSQMRKAAVLANLIPGTPAGHSRLSFVTEGEASLHFAIQNGLPAGAMKQGDGVVIVDAGGGTIDISSYSRNTAKETFEEVAVPQCHFHGSVFVNVHARRFLEGYLADSSFADDIGHIVDCFERTTKLRFRNVDTPQYVKFGSTRDNDADHNIRYGQLKLLGTDIGEFFKPSIDCIIEAVLEQKRNAHKAISHVVLVGGFSASDYMLSNIHAALTPAGFDIHRPENHVNKAVSDGAVSYYLDHFVRTRISKTTYGVVAGITYDPNDPGHRERHADAYISYSGVKEISNVFDVILPKNTQISETKEFRTTYFHDDECNSFKNSILDVYCYRGNIVEPKWFDVDTKNYTKLCSIDVSISNIPVTKRQKAVGVGTYYTIDYEFVLIFGLTELKAYIAWKEGGIEKKSEAQILYEPDDLE